MLGVIITLDKCGLVLTMQGHKKLYEEALVKEIIISTGICVQELMQENADFTEEELCLYLEENFQDIIDDALAGGVEDEE